MINKLINFIIFIIFNIPSSIFIYNIAYGMLLPQDPFSLMFSLPFLIGIMAAFGYLSILSFQFIKNIFTTQIEEDE